MMTIKTKQLGNKFLFAGSTFFLSFGLAFAQATDYHSSGGSAPDIPESPQGTQSDCSGGIVLDDGVAENGYGWNPATVTEGRFLEKFSQSTDFKYTEACFCWTGLTQDTIDFDIEVWDNSGAGGAPGVLLGSMPAQAAGVPDALPGAFYSYDISSLNINVNASDEIYIGARWAPDVEPGFFVCSDESAETPIAGGYAYNNSDGWNTIQAISGGFFSLYRAMLIRADGVEAGTETRATFAVSKEFTDDNPNEVTVSIDCNTGLILDQDKEIAEGDGVEFVVTQFTDGNLNCEITEEPVPGYSASYDDGVTAPNEISCEYTEVQGGDAYSCVIANEPDPVDIKVTKQWEIDGENNNVYLGYQLNLDCNGGEIVGSAYSGGEGPDTEEHTFQVIPEYPSTSCAVFENGMDSAIEVDNGCLRGDVIVSAGSPVSCTITNTIFFEGIPTLSRYGVALFALMMLGVGFVAFRRFG